MTNTTQVPQLSVKLSGMAKSALRIRAAYLGITMSELARRYIEDGLQREEENFTHPPQETDHDTQEREAV